MPNQLNPVQAILNNIDQQSILFIPDGPQDLLLEVTNLSGQTLTLGTESFFRLIFRPSTLVNAVAVPPTIARRGVQLVTEDPTAPAESDREAAAREGSHWSLTPELGGDGSVTFTLKPTDIRTLPPLDPSNARPSRLVLHFSNVQPTPAGQGTRSTPVDIQFSVKVGTVSAVSGGGTPPPPPTVLTGVEKAHLTLLSISRVAYLADERSSAITSARTVPFGAEFIGSNNVFNDGQPSVLKLRVRNITDDPLNLAVGLSKIELLYHAGDDADGQTIGVLTETRNALTSEPLDPVGVRRPWDWNNDLDMGTHQALASGTSWPKGDQGEFQIQLHIPATRRPSGYAPLGLRFSNLPDHPDGELELLVQVGPLFIDHEAAVGITRPLRFYGSENTTNIAVPAPATIGIDNSSGELNIEAPHNVKVTGKLAAPRLRVGVLVAEDSLVKDSPGPGNVTVQHTVTANTFKTTAGFNLEMPKGTILMWSPPNDIPRTFDENSNALVTTAPEGWEICDNRVIPSDPNGARTPNLSGIFIVGQGHYEEEDPADSSNKLKLNYSLLQRFGGAGHVALSEAEMPAHTHSYIDPPDRPGGISVARNGLVGDTGNERFRKDIAGQENSRGFGDSLQLSKAGGGPQGDVSTSGGPTKGHANIPPFFVVVYIIKII